MTSQEVLKIKMLKTLLENIDEDDAKEAEQAIKMIRNLIGEEKRA